MKLVPLPEEISHYKHDTKAKWRYRFPLIALGLISLSGLPVGFFFRGTEYGIPIGAILFVGGAGILFWYSGKKRDIRCSHCSNQMSILDVDWSADLFTQLGGRICGSFFIGADGRIYKEGRYNSGESNMSSYTIDVMKQRWYTCPACKQCFLGQKLLAVTVYKEKAGLKEAVSNIKNNPEAGYKMEELGKK